MITRRGGAPALPCAGCAGGGATGFAGAGGLAAAGGGATAGFGGAGGATVTGAGGAIGASSTTSGSAASTGASTGASATGSAAIGCVTIVSGSGGAVTNTGASTGFSSTGGGAITAEAWRGCGMITRGGLGAAASGAGASGFGGAGGGTAGLLGATVAGGGGIGRGGADGCCACCVIALSTSPGLEMCDKSTLVRISSSGWAARDRGAGPAWARSCCARKWARTRSTSSASSELECVFFSVTPIRGSTSRMALLLTSNSLARSLIRVFCCCIRPFPSSEFPLRVHVNLTAFEVASS